VGNGLVKLPLQRFDFDGATVGHHRDCGDAEFGANLEKNLGSILLALVHAV